MMENATETEPERGWWVWGRDDLGPNAGEYTVWTAMPFATKAEAEDFVSRYFRSADTEVRYQP